MKLALRLLWRDFKAGELWLLLLSLVLAVTTVTAISIFADRIRNSIQDQASQLLAGDIQIRGSSQIPDEWRLEATAQGLQTSDILTFQAMTFSDDQMILASLKAVSNSYPLKGELKIGSEPFVADQVVDHGPASGEAWLASRLFGALGVDIGDTISIGNADFKVAAAIINEPDSGQSFFGVGPRVIINWQDIAETETVQTGSRLRYRLVIAGEQSDIQNYSEWIKPQLGNHHRLVGVENNERSVGSTLDRAESFLLLAGSLGVILAGVSLALAARRYSRRQEIYVALLKTIGMTPQKVQQLYLINLTLIAVSGTLLGLLLGWSIHEAILWIFSGLLPENLMPFGVRPLLTGVVTGLVCLFAFAAPPILALKQTPPARVLRSQDSEKGLSTLKSFAIGLISIVGLVYWYSQSTLITLSLLGGLTLASILVSGLAWLMIRLLRKVGVTLGRTWRIGLANLQRHGKQNALQVMIFSTSLMLLFVLTMVRGALIEDWQKQMPDDIPNHFVYNIFQSELEDVKQFIATHELGASPFYPMVRGRLVAVNGEDAKARIQNASSEGSDDYRRELNLTWSNELAEDNDIVAGSWWQPGDETKNLISIEQSFAEGIQVDLGDTLTFSIAGQLTEVEIASIRTVQWDSLKPNFYVIFSNTILDGLAASYMTSFRMDDRQKPLLTEFARSMPTVSLVEIDAIINQIRGIISQVSLAVEFILLLVLVSGFLVLATSIQATLDDRVKESVILRTLGAKKSLVKGSLLIEFGSLGWLSGLMGAAGAESVLYLLQSQVFDMDFTWHAQIWLLGPWVGMVLIGGVGMLSTSSVTKMPPLAILRAL